VIFDETRSFAKLHTASRTYKTGFFSSFVFWTTCTHSPCSSFLFSVGGTWNILCFLSPPCRRSPGSFTGGRLGGGDVNVEASDSSSELSFPSSPCAGSIISRKQADMSAWKHNFVLLILACGVIFEQHETVLVFPEACVIVQNLVCPIYASY